MKTAIPTQQEYEAREARLHLAKLREVEHAPLGERREAMAQWREALTQCPDVVAERIGWLLEGCYGKGAAMAAARIHANPRLNRVAALSQLVAAVEWACPQAMAVKAWKSLTPAQRRAVDKAIAAEIESTTPAINP